MGMTDIVDTLAAVTAAKEEPGDYVKDGLLYCGHCDTPKQCRISFGDGFRILGCQCACANRRYEADIAAAKDREKRLHIDELRINGIQDKAVRGYTFETSRMTPLLQSCRKYVDGWETVKRENYGLLFWGDVGSGKTRAAACIANALIDAGVPSLMTSFPRILKMSFSEVGEAIGQINQFPLLVIDDLGAERQSEYALETVYTVIDERYKAGNPLIVTTNLPLKDLENPKSIDYARIYSRVLEMCRPVRCSAENLRKVLAKEKQEKFLNFFKED